jgi:23S rRNA (adenine2503-C2)-methyltransferase
MESIEILHTTGRPELAEVFVGRFLDDATQHTAGRDENAGPGHRLFELVDAVDPELPKREKWIINLSTQYGCPVGCPYCDAGGGYKGDLSGEQLLAMVGHVLARNPPDLASRCNKLKVHFSRMGEPALNDGVLEAILRLKSELLPYPGVWACVATTAPTGREAWFEELRRIKEELYLGRFQLQFSLNSTDPEVRRSLVPIPHWSFAEIARFGRSFYRAGDRKVVLNFALAADVPFQPDVVTRWFDPETFAVKLTPINPTDRGRENGFATMLRSTRAGLVDGPINQLRTAGFDVIVSVGDAGEDEIGSNCGQALRLLGAPDSASSSCSGV